MRECKVEGYSIAVAAKHKWLTRKLGWIGRVGAPDRIFIRDGRIVIIEFKAPGKPPRKSQDREIKRMLRYGAEVYIVDSMERVDEILTP